MYYIYMYYMCVQHATVRYLFDWVRRPNHQVQTIATVSQSLLSQLYTNKTEDILIIEIWRVISHSTCLVTWQVDFYLAR